MNNIMRTADVTADEYADLTRRLAQCATVGRYLEFSNKGLITNSYESPSSSGRTTVLNAETPAVCVSPEDTEAILGHLDNLDRQIVLDRSADIVAAEMGGRTER